MSTRKPTLRELAAQWKSKLESLRDEDFENNPANGPFNDRRGPSINPHTGAQEFFFDGVHNLFRRHDDPPVQERNWFHRYDEGTPPMTLLAADSGATEQSSAQPPKPPFVNPLKGEPPIWREPTNEQLRTMSDDLLASRRQTLNTVGEINQWLGTPAGTILGLALPAGIAARAIRGGLGYAAGNVLEDKLDSLSDAYGHEYYRRGYGR